MKLRCSVRHRFSAPADAMFDFTNDPQNFVSFTGYGPIPGIRRADYVTEGEPKLGSRRLVLKTDGTEHTEEIVGFERPHRHTSRVAGFGPPFSWLVRWGEDDWRFSSSGSGTLVDRTFTFELTSPLVAPVALILMHIFMKAALQRDLRNIARAVGQPAG